MALGGEGSMVKVRGAFAFLLLATTVLLAVQAQGMYFYVMRICKFSSDPDTN